MYCHDILALDAIIHSASLSFLLSTNTHYTVCVCECPLLKSYICLFSWRDVRNDCPAIELHRNVWNVCIYSSCRLDHCTFHSPQIKFAHLCLPNHCDFHCILMWCRGPRHSPLDMAFPFNQTMCDRVGVYLLLERKWNSIAIIKSY